MHLEDTAVGRAMARLQVGPAWHIPWYAMCRETLDALDGFISLAHACMQDALWASEAACWTEDVVCLRAGIGEAAKISAALDGALDGPLDGPLDGALDGTLDGPLDRAAVVQLLPAAAAPKEGKPRGCQHSSSSSLNK